MKMFSHYDIEILFQAYWAAIELHKKHGARFENIPFFVLCYALDKWFLNTLIEPILTIKLEMIPSRLDLIHTLLEDVMERITAC